MAIYFIQADDGPIKIGFSGGRHSRRFSSIRTNSHAELKLLAIIDGTLSQENEMHKRFDSLHIRGEWFRPGAPLLAFLATLPPPPSMSKKRHFRTLPKSEIARIKRIWFDRSLTVIQAVEKTGFTLATLYRHFGPVGRPIMPPGKAEAMQRKSVAKRTEGRIPKREAMGYWRDPRLTIGEAIERMPGWSARAAYMRLGKRGLPVGPRGGK